MLISVAYAQAQNTAQQPSVFETMVLPFAVVFAIFYFLIIRPQGKKQKQLQTFLTNLKKGDKVLTNSGILGTIQGITDKFVDIEISDGVSVKMLKSQIAGPMKEG